jgi:SAM-dependent methyltransferase
LNRDAFYGDDYAARNPGWHTEESAWKAARIGDLLRDEGLSPRRVVEVGCGAGEVLHQLSTRLPGARFTGFDIAEAALAIGRHREGERLRLVHGEAPAAIDEPWDLLLCLDVVEHVEDCIGFLRRLRPLARDHVLHIPLEASAQAVLRGWPLQYARDKVGHLHFFTRETALATVEAAGYEVLAARFTPGALDHPRSPKARLARLPRRVGAIIAPHATARVLGGFSLLVLAR